MLETLVGLFQESGLHADIALQGKRRHYVDLEHELSPASSLIEEEIVTSSFCAPFIRHDALVRALVVERDGLGAVALALGKVSVAGIVIVGSDKFAGVLELDLASENSCSETCLRKLLDSI